MTPAGEDPRASFVAVAIVGLARRERSKRSSTTGGVRRKAVGISSDSFAPMSGGAHIRRRGAGLPVAFACLLVLAGHVCAAGAATASYVALGDSYASGEGLGPYQPGTAQKTGPKRNLCHRSAGDAYADLTPAIVLPTVSSRAFWACSGATVADMESASTGQYGQLAQVSQVGRRTRYITVSVGGDDLGFGAVGRACAALDRNHRAWKRFSSTSCAAQLQASAARMETLQNNLIGLYERLLTAAPSASLVVSGYPRIFPASYNGLIQLPVCTSWKGSTCSKQSTKKSAEQPFCILDHYPAPFETLDVGLTESDASAVDRFEQELNSTIQSAITTVGRHSQFARRIGYADTYTPAIARNCQGTTPNATVAGFEISPHGRGNGGGASAFVSSATFHPTNAGQSEMATAVQNEFTALAGAPAPLAAGPPVQINTASLPASTIGIGGGAENAAFDGAGDLWITESGGLGEIDPQGNYTYQQVEGEQDDGSGDVATGSDGSVWFTSLEQVGTVDSDGYVNTFDNLSLDQNPSLGLPDAIALGPDNGIWFTDEANPASINEIDDNGDITRLPIPTPSASWMLPGLISGPDGALWFTEDPFGKGTAPAIGRITTSGQFRSFPLSSSSAPGAIVAGPDGALWFTDRGLHSIGRISTSGQITEFPVPSSVDKYGPFGMTVDAGAVWFTTSTHVGEIVPSGAMTIWPVSGAQDLAGIVAASDGSLWVVDGDADEAFHITPP